MEPRHKSEKNTEQPTTDIFVNEIQKLQLSVGICEKIQGLKKQKPIMSGHLSCHIFHGGLSMHAITATEQQNTSNALELPAGVSFNFIFAGTVQFNFANQQCSMSAKNKDTCTTIINDSDELMTRFMKQGMRISKLNIFVEQQWLANRFNSTLDKQKLQTIFSHKQVLAWKANEKIMSQARHLMTIKQAVNFDDNLHVEHLTIALIRNCIMALWQQLEEQNKNYQKSLLPARNFKNNSLKTAINQHLESLQTVSEIATAMNMTERTLQRKFQATYQESAASYIRQRKLEKAKRALIFDHKSIGEVAFAAGYNHTSNFINAFKKQFGSTPLEFIKLYQNNAN